ncbi:antitoxin [Nocardioides rubriscoriae]|uniref:antitoxin n=1 Tax=Nocardioides rubriscoriae TaxID=642762 RepID=UPI0011DF06B9|nr:antitoxin [Nocardioides rubriscoriae]
MERRLQLLLDQERYDRVAAEATRSGRSVAAVIREAIDLRFDDCVQLRRGAVEDLLALADGDDAAPGEGPLDYKQRWDDDLAAHQDRLLR